MSINPLYEYVYKSPLGDMCLVSSNEGLTSACFVLSSKGNNDEPDDSSVIGITKEWLDIYFSGSIPDFTPPLDLIGTPFQKIVWKTLLEIPYGETRTYGEIAKELETKFGKRVSARAVGGAVGRNPISIIVPCHRVLGANSAITGYAAGISKKIYLLTIEGIIK